MGVGIGWVFRASLLSLCCYEGGVCDYVVVD
jgi:hypothetical protein